MTYLKTNNNLNSVKIKRSISIILGITYIISYFLPYAKYEFAGYLFKASSFDLLTSRGLAVENSVIIIPIIIKLSLASGLISTILAIFFITYNKVIISGFLYIISSLCPIIILLSGTKIHSSIMALGIGSINIEYLISFTLTLILGLISAILAISIRGTEKLAEVIFLVFSCVSIGAVIIITVYIFTSGVPAIAEIGLLQFLFGTHWDPANNQYGILYLIISSILATLGSIIIGVPIGLLTASYLSEIASKRYANILRPAVQLLAGIPSVVYGFFGMLIIVPTIRNIFPNSLGDSLLAVIIILSIMVLPTIISTSETSLRAVPNTYREAALSLGTTPIKTIFKVTIPAAKSGILSGIILGVGRAIGETMAVIMVAGNVVNMPSLLGTVRLLTTGIVLEMSYSSGLHRQALFAIGLILFIFIIIVNISFTAISKKGVNMNDK